MSKAAFLDRDGVINRKAPDGHYITRWEDFEFLPRVAEAIRLLERGGFSVIVVSNQRCVAKGLLTIAELELYPPTHAETTRRRSRPSYSRLLLSSRQRAVLLLQETRPGNVIPGCS